MACNADLLRGLKVVDMGTGMAPALVGKMLADAGAEVVWVPPVGGDPFEELYPAYSVWRGGQRRDDAAAAHPERLAALLRDADVCVVGGEDYPDLQRREDAEELARRHPRLVALDIRGYPSTYEAHGRPANDILAQARSGLAWEQRPDRPIVMSFEPSAYGAALQGLIGILGALYEREASGAGQAVSTSLFEGCLVWAASYWAKLEKPTPAADFVIPKGVAPLIFRCKDGVFIHIVVGGAGSKYGVYQVLGIDDPSVTPADSGMPKPGAGPREFYGDYDLLARHAAQKTSTEVLEGLAARGLPAEPVLPPGRCWDNPQIARNGVIRTDPEGRRSVGLPFLARTNPAGAPRPGEAGRKPLAGVRILDTGAFVAGPYATVSLTDLGAEVIKVEPPAGDPSRAIFKAFTSANRGKLGVAVDLKHPDGRKLVEDLCRRSDVVCNNFRPGVSTRLGIDPESLHALRSDLIVLESPAYGAEGALAGKSGFDMVMQAWCGHEFKGGGGGDPLWNRTTMVDYAAGMLGSIAILMALYHRARTGEGVTLEAPLVNSGIFLLSELVQQPDGRFEGAASLLASQSGYTPAEALYPVKDGWAAVVARGPAAALRLSEALGLQSTLPEDVSTWGEEAEAAIAAAVADQTVESLQAKLEPHGVWVERCLEGLDGLLVDVSLKERGVVRTTTHPTFGAVTEFGVFLGMSRSQVGADRAAPLVGQATRDVLAEIGYSPAQVEDLITRAVVA